MGTTLQAPEAVRSGQLYRFRLSNCGVARHRGDGYRTKLDSLSF